MLSACVFPTTIARRPMRIRAWTHVVTVLLYDVHCTTMHVDITWRKRTVTPWTPVTHAVHADCTETAITITSIITIQHTSTRCVCDDVVLVDLVVAGDWCNCRCYFTRWCYLQSVDYVVVTERWTLEAGARVSDSRSFDSQRTHAFFQVQHRGHIPAVRCSVGNLVDYSDWREWFGWIVGGWHLSIDQWLYVDSLNSALQLSLHVRFDVHHQTLARIKLGLARSA